MEQKLLKLQRVLVPNHLCFYIFLENILLLNFAHKAFPWNIHRFRVTSETRFFNHAVCFRESKVQMQIEHQKKKIKTSVCFSLPVLAYRSTTLDLSNGCSKSQSFYHFVHYQIIVVSSPLAFQLLNKKPKTVSQNQHYSWQCGPLPLSGGQGTAIYSDPWNNGAFLNNATPGGQP